MNSSESVVPESVRQRNTTSSVSRPARTSNVTFVVGHPPPGEHLLGLRDGDAGGLVAGHGHAIVPLSPVPARQVSAVLRTRHDNGVTVHDNIVMTSGVAGRHATSGGCMRVQSTRTHRSGGRAWLRFTGVTTLLALVAVSCSAKGGEKSDGADGSSTTEATTTASASDTADFG